MQLSANATLRSVRCYICGGPLIYEKSVTRTFLCKCQKCGATVGHSKPIIFVEDKALQ